MLGNPFAGLRITFSLAALEDTKERLFPTSRHRSRRIHKKLVKRFGGEFKRVPCMWKTPAGIIAHPAFKDQLEWALSQEAL
ncbi:hypothetical protein [Sinorhizobium medicae]